MTNSIVEKAKQIVDGIEIGFFDTAKNWHTENYADYYLHFNDADYETRKYALLVFCAALGNWYNKPANVFIPIEIQMQHPDFHLYKDKIYRFELYVEAFLEHHEAIKQQFPLLYNAMVFFLIQLDREQPFEEIFHSVDEQLFIELREIVAVSNIDENYRYNFNDLLRELDLPTFFKN